VFTNTKPNMSKTPTPNVTTITSHILQQSMARRASLLIGRLKASVFQRMILTVRVRVGILRAPLGDDDEHV
jgi:hypothetical protein